MVRGATPGGARSRLDAALELCRKLVVARAFAIALPLDLAIPAIVARPEDGCTARRYEQGDQQIGENDPGFDGARSVPEQDGTPALIRLPGDKVPPRRHGGG